MPVFLGFVSGVILGCFFIYFPFTVLSISLITVLLLFKKSKTVGGLFAIFLVFGIIIGSENISKSFQQQKNIEACGYVKNSHENFYTFYVFEGKDLKNKTLTIYSKEKLEEGESYKIECSMLDAYRNPYQHESSFCYLRKAQPITFFKTRAFELRQRINKKIEDSLNEEIAGTLIAMTTGERVSIPQETKEDFRKTGLIHLLSISGAHFSLLFTACFIIFNFLIKRLPYKILVRMTLYIKPSQISILICFPILLGYFLIVEPNYPSTRAFIMATLFMIGVLSERKSLWIFTVSIACFLILIVEPHAIKDLSFQLSFLATAAIGFASDVYKNFKEKINNKILSYIFLSFLISTAATVFTAPLIIYRFHYLSIISPLANLTAGVLIGMVLFPLHILFVAVFLIAGVYPFPELINFIGAVSFKVMHFLASFKYSSTWIPPISVGAVVIFYVSASLLLVSFYLLKGSFRRVGIALSALLFSLSIFISAFMYVKDRDTLKLTFLDVGQAESTIVETPEGVFLIDTGKTGWQAVEFLKAKAVKRIDALIITHEEKDHAGGFERIIKNFQINEIWDNGHIYYNAPVDSKLRHIERGDVLKIGSCSFTVLHPYKGFWTSSLSKSSNELALIFKLRCFKHSYLFTSDAGKEALQTLPVQYLKSELVKIPHHGSKNSFLEGFYDYVSPKFCIISAGKNNPYGHPHRIVIDELEKHCRILRTDMDGAIQIRETKNGKIKIQTMKESEFLPYNDWENLKKLFILW